MVALDDALSDADIDRTFFYARWPTVSKVAEIAFGKNILLRIVNDACLLSIDRLVRRG